MATKVLLRQVNQDYSSVNRYHCERVGCPIKRQRQQLLVTDSYLRISVKHQVSACSNSVSCIKGH